MARGFFLGWVLIHGPLFIPIARGFWGWTGFWGLVFPFSQQSWPLFLLLARPAREHRSLHFFPAPLQVGFKCPVTMAMKLGASCGPGAQWEMGRQSIPVMCVH